MFTSVTTRRYAETVVVKGVPDRPGSLVQVSRLSDTRL